MVIWRYGIVDACCAERENFHEQVVSVKYPKNQQILHKNSLNFVLHSNADYLRQDFESETISI